jgi:hypothetical protein
VHWRHGDPVASGHLESEFLAFSDSEEEARAAVGSLLLNDVKQRLDALIKSKSAESIPWWEVMRREDQA